MNEIITTEQVVRYVARDNPRHWVEHENTTADRFRQPGLCGEIAVYSDPRPSRHWQGHYDGICAEIHSYRDTEFLVDVFLSLPNRSRKQFRFMQRYAFYAEAKAEAVKHIREMYRLLYKSNVQPADM